MNLSKKIKVFIILVIITGIGLFIGYKIIYKPHKSTESIEAVYIGTADMFKAEVESNQEKWQNGIIKIEGTITSVDSEGITLNQSIYCQFENKLIEPLESGTKITIKGRFIGYDDLLEEIKFDKCIMSNWN